MGLENRTRDFSDATIDALREKLQGPQEEYRELRNFYLSYNEYFDTDFLEQANYIDAQMSGLREFMHYTTAMQLNKVTGNVAAHEAAYSAACDNILEGLEAYNAVLDALTAEIGRPRFGATFNPAAFQAQLNGLKPVVRGAKEAFVADMQAQYGFTQDTAEVLWRVWEGVADKYTDETEAAWAFNRILASVWYDHEDSFWFRGFLAYAGGNTPFSISGMPVSEKEYFMLLGLSEDEYKSLRCEIRVQHLIQSHQGNIWDDLKKDERTLYDRFINEMRKEFGNDVSLKTLEKEWNAYVGRYGGKTDFAHQSIASAVYLCETLNMTGLPANVYSGGQPGAYASWYGDICEGGGKVSNDDYKADLDATNINFYMAEYGMGYMQARGNYYNDITSGGATRAELFTQPGNVPIEQVEIDLMNAYGGKDLGPANMAPEDRRAWMAQNLPNTKAHDAYRFWQSLAMGTNDMVP